MSKKVLVCCLVIALVAALAGPSAAAKKKKKKGPKPYQSEEVSIQIGHPVFNGASGSVVGVTAQEFINTCQIPGSNGLDAYVFEVPDPYRKITSSIETTTTSAGIVAYDIDIYLFDDACELKAAFQAVGEEEVGVLPKGIAYILLHNYEPDPVTTQFELKPTK